jgi:gamma-glutamylcyclotransferase
MPAYVWFFAYGSNMSSSLIRSRAREVVEEQVGKLENYEIVFNKKARGGSATANIHPASGKTVYGVLYKIHETALRALDRFEGAPQHYRRIELNVTDSQGNRVPAQTYIATKVEKGLRPASYYLQSILQAADEHHLPAEYVEELKATAGGA